MERIIEDLIKLMEECNAGELATSVEFKKNGKVYKASLSITEEHRKGKI